MTWRSIKDEELDICRKMVLWLEIRKEWDPKSDCLPTEPDLYKSALFERILNGIDPLPYPPPIGLACPWYAIVEDRGPHFVGDNFGGKQNPFGPYFRVVLPNHNFTTISYEEANAGDEVTIIQNRYWIEERISSTEFIIKDAYHDTPYRFRMWYDPDYPYASNPDGGWMMNNVDFDK